MARRPPAALLAVLLLGLSLRTEAREPVPGAEGRVGYREAAESSEPLGEGELKASVRGGTLMARRGYTPVQVTLQNNASAPRMVRLSFDPQYGSGGRFSERTVEVGPRQRVVTHVLVPAEVQGGTLTLESAGLPPQRQGLYLQNFQGGGAVLVLGTAKELEAATALAPTDEEQQPLFSARFLDPQGAPRELGAYVGYDAVLVATEADAVPADVWATLEAYAATGGRLVLAHPPRDLSTRLPLTHIVSEQAPAYGFGQVRRCRAAVTCGTLLAADLEDAAAVVVPAGPAQRWERGSALRGGEQPLLSSARAPVGLFLVLIFLFTLAVGPGGMMLARRKGPVAVLVAVPAVAFVTCVALVAWSVLVDGFAVHAARYSLTLLDRERSRAVTVGLGAWYANLSSDALRMPGSSVLLAPEGTEGPVADLDWTNGFTVRSGFLPSRTYREWGEVAVLPSRARLVARRDGGGVIVQNALGGPLLGGRVNLGGALWTLPALAEGAEGRATPVASGPEEWDPVEGMSHHAQRRFPTGVALLSAALPEGGFLARLGGLGPAPTASVAVELEDALHVVRGQVEEGRK